MTEAPEKLRLIKREAMTSKYRNVATVLLLDVISPALDTSRIIPQRQSSGIGGEGQARRTFASEKSCRQESRLANQAATGARSDKKRSKGNLRRGITTWITINGQNRCFMPYMVVY